MTLETTEDPPYIITFLLLATTNTNALDIDYTLCQQNKQYLLNKKV